MQRVYVTLLFPRYYAKMRRTKGRRVVFVFVPQLRECCFLRTCVCVHNVGFHFQLVSWTNGRKVSRCGVFRTRFLFIGGFLRKWEFSGFRMCLIENGWFWWFLSWRVLGFVKWIGNYEVVLSEGIVVLVVWCVGVCFFSFGPIIEIEFFKIFRIEWLDFISNFGKIWLFVVRI